MLKQHRENIHEMKNKNVKDYIDFSSSIYCLTNNKNKVPTRFLYLRLLYRLRISILSLFSSQFVYVIYDPSIHEK